MTGDGRDDLMVNQVTYINGGYRADHFSLYKSAGSGSNITFIKINNYPSTGQICSGTFNNFSSQNGDGQFFYIGDFDGDGTSDYVTILSNQTGVNKTAFKVFLSFPSKSIYNKEVTNINNWCYAEDIWVNSDDRTVLEFDGDGRQELMLTKGNTTKIFSFKKVGSNWTAEEKYSAGFPTEWHLTYLGDFNGDGKTDMLTRDADDNSATWYKAINTGVGFVETAFSFQHQPDILGSYSDDKLILSDFNGDGKTDIFHGWDYFIGNTAYNSRLDLYYSTGNDFYYKQNFFSKLLSFAPLVVFDSNGDGRADLINRTHYNSPFDILYFRKEGQEHLLQKVKNGIDYDIEFQYKRLTQTSNFYTKGSVSYHPVNNVQLPIHTVSRYKSENGIGGFTTIDYQYEEAKLHKEGKGLLGFKKITASNTTTGFKNIIENEYNSTYYTFVPKKISNYRIAGNTLIDSKNFNNSFINQGSKRFWYRVNNIVHNKAFESRFVETDFSNYDNYGNAQTQTITTEDVDETITITSTYGQYGTPVPAKITSRTENILRSGQPAFSTQTTYTYNSIGQLTGKTEFNGLPKSVSFTFGYNNLGNQTSTVVSPTGMTTRTKTKNYDSKGRFVTSSTDALGQIKVATYDARWGKPTMKKWQSGSQIDYTYDAFGRLKTSTNPQNITTTNTYSWDINTGEKTIHYMLSETPGSPKAKVWYDVLDREKKSSTESYGTNLWTNVVTNYDYRGNVQFQTIPYIVGLETGIGTTYTYDIYNRISTEQKASVGTTSYAYAYSNGNLTTTVTNPAGQSSSTVIDASGQTISSTDNGGTLTYIYYSHGNIKETKQGSTVLVSNEYDAYARQTKLIDINAGTTDYTTDALGQITSTTNANNETTTSTYDKLGRLINHIRPEGTTTYEYHISSTNTANKLKKITHYGGMKEEFYYDSFGRVSSFKETIDNLAHNTFYFYNSYNQIATLIYPSGLALKYNYNSKGYLNTITNSANTVTIFSANSKNGLNQYTSYTLGNGKTTTISRPVWGIPTNYTTSGVQNLSLTWNYTNGNLTSRNDAIKNKTESFSYDNLERLLSSSGTGLATIANTYSANGNINSKTDVGSYTYSSSKINAVTNVSNSQNNISTTTQDITYNSFLQPETLSEGNYDLTYTYGSDDQRRKSVLKQNGSTVNTRYYFGDYEKDITGSTTRHLHYITAGEHLVSIVERINYADTYHYTYTDHLGSILAVTNSSGTVTAEQNFDAWGRKRNPNTWTYSNIPATPTWLYRGYTMHEHLPEFGLINMNGRMYDPLVGRMLSTDNFIHDNMGIGGFNRYTYAFNNPLKYTDPDGEHPIVIGAMIGAMMNLGVKAFQGQINSPADLFAAIGIGALSGALGGVASLTGGTTFLNAVSTGISSGVIGDLFLQVGNGLYFGDPFSMKQLAFSGAIGGIVGGIGWTASNARIPGGYSTPPGPGDDLLTELDLIAKYGDDISSSTLFASRSGNNMLPGGATYGVSKSDDVWHFFNNLNELDNFLFPLYKIQSLPLSSLNPTHYVNNSKSVTKRLFKSIKAEGIKEPIEYVMHNSNKYVVGGNHRYHIAQKLGIENVPTKRVRLPFASYRTPSDLLMEGRGHPGFWKFLK
ncbi:MAG: FG-GAP-like repeat-containing protein [Chitinophagales bacterium]